MGLFDKFLDAYYAKLRQKQNEVRNQFITARNTAGYGQGGYFPEHPSIEEAPEINAPRVTSPAVRIAQSNAQTVNRNRNLQNQMQSYLDFLNQRGNANQPIRSFDRTADMLERLSTNKVDPYRYGSAVDAANLFEKRMMDAVRAGNSLTTSPMIQQMIRDRATAENQPPAAHSLADDIEAQIMALANQPDIPGHWISPYSQEYLNQLGDRLGQTGSEAQAAFNAAKQDIIDNYARGVTNRAQAEGGIFNKLAANAQNIGVDYAKGSLGQEAVADSNYLNQAAQQNQATDLSFNDKLGSMAAMLGQTLGMQAREGLLTPKQWVGPQSGLDAGEQAQLAFLQNKWNRLLDKEEADAAAAAESEDLSKYLTQLTRQGEERSLQTNPLVPETFANISDPRLKDAAQSLYDSAGGNPVDALKLAQERLAEATKVRNSYPRYGGGGGSAGAAPMVRAAQEITMANQLIELFRKLSSSWTGVPVSRETTDSTTAKAPVGIDPTILALLLR